MADECACLFVRRPHARTRNTLVVIHATKPQVGRHDKRFESGALAVRANGRGHRSPPYALCRALASKVAQQSVHPLTRPAHTWDLPAHLGYPVPTRFTIACRLATSNLDSVLQLESAQPTQFRTRCIVRSEYVMDRYKQGISAQSVAEGLGWFSVGLGLAEMVRHDRWPGWLASMRPRRRRHAAFDGRSRVC
jgi:hypothetical protein